MGRNVGVFPLFLPFFVPFLPAAAATKLEDHACYKELYEHEGHTSMICQNKDLTGTIPAALGTKTQLTRLYLYGNQLNGTIPAALGKLPALEDLHLWKNRLSGPVPAALGKLPALEYLRLSENRLTGCVPRSIGLCASGIDDSPCDITKDGSNPEITGRCPLKRPLKNEEALFRPQHPALL